MFENVGQKIKTIAKFIWIVGAIYAAYCFFVFWDEGEPFEAVVNLILTPIVSFVVSMCMYGFGELVERAERENETSEQIAIEKYRLPIASGTETEQAYEAMPKAGQWKCSSCGKINANYVGTCGCGQVRK